MQTFVGLVFVAVLLGGLTGFIVWLVRREQRQQAAPPAGTQPLPPGLQARLHWWQAVYAWLVTRSDRVLQRFGWYRRLRGIQQQGQQNRRGVAWQGPRYSDGMTPGRQMFVIVFGLGLGLICGLVVTGFTSWRWGLVAFTNISILVMMMSCLLLFGNQLRTNRRDIRRTRRALDHELDEEIEQRRQLRDMESRLEAARTRVTAAGGDPDTDADVQRMTAEVRQRQQQYMQVLTSQERQTRLDGLVTHLRELRLRRERFGEEGEDWWRRPWYGNPSGLTIHVSMYGMWTIMLFVCQWITTLVAGNWYSVFGVPVFNPMALGAGLIGALYIWAGFSEVQDDPVVHRAMLVFLLRRTYTDYDGGLVWVAPLVERASPIDVEKWSIPVTIENAWTKNNATVDISEVLIVRGDESRLYEFSEIDNNHIGRIVRAIVEDRFRTYVRTVNWQDVLDVRQDMLDAVLEYLVTGHVPGEIIPPSGLSDSRDLGIRIIEAPIPKVHVTGNLGKMLERVEVEKKQREFETLDRETRARLANIVREAADKAGDPTPFSVFYAIDKAYAAVDEHPEAARLYPDVALLVQLAGKFFGGRGPWQPGGGRPPQGRPPQGGRPRGPQGPQGTSGTPQSVGAGTPGTGGT